MLYFKSVCVNVRQNSVFIRRLCKTVYYTERFQAHMKSRERCRSLGSWISMSKKKGAVPPCLKVACLMV